MGSATTAFTKLNLNALLRPRSVKRMMDVLRIAFIATTLFFIALAALRISNATIASLISSTPMPNITESPVEKGPKRDYSEIAKRNVFQTEAKSVPVAPVKSDEPPVTQLPLQLIGTFVTQGKAPYAIIENTKEKIQDVFNLGETIFGEAKLVKILPQNVELKRGTRIEVLKLLEEGAIPDRIEGAVAEVGEDTFVVSEIELDKALDNLPLLLSQARAVPYFKDGKSVGLRLFAIKPNSLFQKIGLKNGDILKTINGKSMADPSQALKLFQELKDQRSLKVNLERNREPREFKYEIR